VQIDLEMKELKKEIEEEKYRTASDIPTKGLGED